MSQLEVLNASIAVNFPLLYWGAFGFYAGLLLFLVLPVVRKKMGSVLGPIQPVNQSPLSCLDGIRGLAALWVACFHIWEWNRPFFDGFSESIFFFSLGPKSVAIFGALSGFLVYRSALKWRDTGDLKAFYQRRFFRIYPMVFVALTGFLFCQHKNPLTPTQVASQYLLGPMYFQYNSIYPPFWSLWPELTFYMMVPIWILFTRGRNLLSSSVAFLCFFFLVGTESIQYSLFFYFIVGILCADLYQHPKFKKIPPALGGLLFWLFAFLSGCFFMISELR